MQLFRRGLTSLCRKTDGEGEVCLAVRKNKHGIGFEEASSVFDDPFSYEVFDESNSLDEDRYRVTGAITGFVLGRFVTVSVTYRDELIRIFSARDAGQTEIEEYNNGVRSILG